MSTPAAARDFPKNGAGRPEKPLPRQLREIRHALGLTLSEAATRAGIRIARLSELERGERPPNVDELSRLQLTYQRRLRVVVAIVEDVA